LVHICFYVYVLWLYILWSYGYILSRFVLLLRNIWQPCSVTHNIPKYNQVNIFW
jgi:hypothetical protein